MIDLSQFKNWIFDMDGTLTHAVHDFEAIKRQLGLPLDRDILSSLELLSEEEKKITHEKLEIIEEEIARKARPQEGCFALLSKLVERGCNLGILTRNSLENAEKTLRYSGLLKFFTEEKIICRHKATPKPDPAGIYLLLDTWKAEKRESIMVGDYLFDLLAGKNAGIRTLYFDPEGIYLYKEYADYSIDSYLRIVLE